MANALLDVRDGMSDRMLSSSRTRSTYASRPSRRTDRWSPRRYGSVDSDGILRAVCQQRQGQGCATTPGAVTPPTPGKAPRRDHWKGAAKRANGDVEIRISQLLYRKYGLMKMSFDLWGAIKQLDWAVFAIEV